MNEILNTSRALNLIALKEGYRAILYDLPVLYPVKLELLKKAITEIEQEGYRESSIDSILGEKLIEIYSRSSADRITAS